MLEYLLSLSLLIVVVLLIRGIFRKTVSPRAIYALWLVVVLRMLLPITLFEVNVTLPEFMQRQQIVQEEQSEQLLEDSEISADVQEQTPLSPPMQTLPTIPSQSTSQTTPEHPTIITPVTPTIPVTPAIPNDNTPVTPGTSETTPDEAIKPDETVSEAPEEPVSINLMRIADLVWFCGAVIASVWVLLTSITYSRRLKKDRVFHRSVRGTRVYVSEYAGVPCIAGLIPSIYITPEAANSKSEILIIIHEHVHLRHGDHIWSIIRALALIVFWWNPLVWVAATVSKQDAELACDDAISSRMNDDGRLKYANILIDTIPQKHRYAVGLGSAPMKERILMLTKKQKNRWLSLILTIVLAVSAVGCSFVEMKPKTLEQPEESGNEGAYKINTLVAEEVTDGSHDRKINIIEVELDSAHTDEINKTISTFFLDQYHVYLNEDGRGWNYQLIDTTYAVKGNILGVTGLSRTSATSYPYCYASCIFYDLEQGKLCTAEDYLKAAGLDLTTAEEQIDKILSTDTYYASLEWELISVIFIEDEPVLVVKVIETTMQVEQPETIRLIGYKSDRFVPANDGTYFNGFDEIEWVNLVRNEFTGKWETEVQIKNAIKQYMHTLVSYLHDPFAPGEAEYPDTILGLVFQYCLYNQDKLSGVELNTETFNMSIDGEVFRTVASALFGENFDVDSNPLWIAYAGRYDSANDQYTTSYAKDYWGGDSHSIDFGTDLSIAEKDGKVIVTASVGMNDEVNGYYEPFRLLEYTFTRIEAYGQVHYRIESIAVAEEPQTEDTQNLSQYSIIPSNTNGSIVSLKLPSAWQWDGTNFNDSNVKIDTYSYAKRVTLYGALPTLQEFEDTLQNSTGRVYQMSYPITGRTDAGYAYTGYYGDEEMPKGEMSRRYLFYISTDHGAYELEVWQRLDSDGENFFEDTVLPIVQSFAIQQTLTHQAIMENLTMLYDTLSKKEMLLSDWLKNNEYAVSKYTVIDLDRDANLETVLWLTRGNDEYAGFLILHSNAGKTNAHLLYYRQFADLKEDGTFNFSGGVSNGGIGEIRFEGDTYVINKIVYRESSDNQSVYYYSVRDGKTLTKSEYESFEKAQNNKADPVWYARTANEETSAQPIDFSSIGGEWYHSFRHESWYAFYGLNFHSETSEMQFDYGVYESEYANRYNGTYTVDSVTQEITAVMHDDSELHQDADITLKFTLAVRTDGDDTTLVMHIRSCSVKKYQHLVGQYLEFTRGFGYAELEYRAVQGYYQMWYDKELTVDVLLDKYEVKKDVAKKVREATGIELLATDFIWEYAAEEDRFPLRFFVTDDTGTKMIETNIIRYKDEKDGIEKYAVEVNPTVIAVE